MTEAVRLYGTDVLPAVSERIKVGRLSFTLEEGALRHICVDGTEIIRGIAFLVRDGDWGTLTPKLFEVSRNCDAKRFSVILKAGFDTANATLEVSIFIDAGPAGLSMRAEGLPNGTFETNRTGFSVLHPAGLAGRPVSIIHSDGTTEASTFPTLIDPWQPFMDIISMTHRANGLAVCCAFEGDTFETEDQRQWGDASYKTYVRPLALPWPYFLTDAEPFSQSVSIEWVQDNAQFHAFCDKPTISKMAFPETAIFLTAQDASRLLEHPEDIVQVSPQRLLCHLDATTNEISKQIKTFAKLQASLPELIFDLELICGFDKDPLIELQNVQSTMLAAGLKPDSVLICPAVDRQSTPPGSDWPFCPPLTEIHKASAAVFADCVRGGGMVSFFPELNRKRPPVELLDFVSHSLCPIVHAADDISVMETLETIPHITRTARAIMGEASYRIGPSTIAMRLNPYGQRTILNHDRSRVCMAHDDPRHGAVFGGAYVIGLACALAPAGVAVWTPSELYGPRGLKGPLNDAIALLASCAGERVQKAVLINGTAELIIGQTRILANLTSEPQFGLLPYEFKAT